MQLGRIRVCGEHALGRCGRFFRRGLGIKGARQNFSKDFYGQWAGDMWRAGLGRQLGLVVVLIVVKLTTDNRPEITYWHTHRRAFGPRVGGVMARRSISTITPAPAAAAVAPASATFSVLLGGAFSRGLCLGLCGHDGLLRYG